MTERFVWYGPVGDRGGYGNVARNFVHGLVQRDADIAVQSVGPMHRDVGEDELSFLASLSRTPSGDETVVLHTNPAELRAGLEWLREQFPGRIAACTIAETDRVPASWAAACNHADEVWVPTTFNHLTFARSGVDLERLRIVPYGIDAASWPAEGPVAEDVAPPEHFCFLYTFAFDWRKGFDRLIAAYLNEFTQRDPVSLVLKIWDPRPEPRRDLRLELKDAVAPLADLSRTDLPRFVFIDQPIERERLAALYRRANLYISTERASGWGMPCFEAMAMGRPAAAVDWSGSTEFMHVENSLLIETGGLVPVDERLARERPDYAGQRWPELSLAAVQKVLRLAVSGEVDLAALGQRAREEITTRWTAYEAAGHILSRNVTPYRPAAGLLERLRPLVGLAGDSPFADARSNVLVAAFGDRCSEALDAYLDAFGPDEDVTLLLWGRKPRTEEELGGAVVAHLERRGIPIEQAPDLMVCVGDPEEALVEQRVRALVEPAAFWPAGRRRVQPESEALRKVALPRTAHAA